MSDNVPAIPDRAPSREVAVTDTDSWIDVARPIIALAERIADTEFVPKGLRGSAPATAAAMLYGREVGLPPMTALNVTHVVEGKPGIEAEAMRAMVFAAGHELEFVETTGAICTMRGRRSGQEKWTELSWTIDAARAAGLTGKSNWKSYPRAMLVARATTDLCRMIFPDVIHGFRTVEELDDLDTEGTEPTAQPAAGRKVSRGRKPAAALPAGQRPPLEAPTARPETSGPPLPGEEGYEDVTRAAVAPTGQPVGGGSTTEGEAAEEPPPTGAGPESGESVGGSPDSEDSPENGVEAPAGDTTTSEVAAPDGPPPEAPERRGPRKASRAQLRMIEGTLTTIGVDEDRDERHLIAGSIVGRPIGSFNDLTSGDASKVIDTLARIPDKAALSDFLDALEDAKGDEE